MGPEKLDRPECVELRAMVAQLIEANRVLTVRVAQLAEENAALRREVEEVETRLRKDSSSSSRPPSSDSLYVIVSADTSRIASERRPGGPRRHGAFGDSASGPGRDAGSSPAIVRILRRIGSLCTYAADEGVQCTNNLARRVLRPAVLWRKGSYGTQSDRGSPFAERMLLRGAILAARHSLHARRRGLLAFLEDALRAEIHGLKPSSVLPTP